jgi:formate dehydrogenase major subunit
MIAGQPSALAGQRARRSARWRLYAQDARQGGGVAVRNWLRAWPVYRQLTGADPWGRGKAVESDQSATLVPRTATADRVARSVCPYCAVGCAQKVYVKDEQVVQIEGDQDSPISRGRLCPKGSASKQLVTGDHRARKVLYRPPYGAEWQELDLDSAMDMVADRVLNARRKGWQDTDEHGNPLRRTLGIASLGGATLDNEENYLIKKLFTALGAVQIENQARI